MLAAEGPRRRLTSKSNLDFRYLLYDISQIICYQSTRGHVFMYLGISSSCLPTWHHGPFKDDMTHVLPLFFSSRPLLFLALFQTNLITYFSIRYASPMMNWDQTSSDLLYSIPGSCRPHHAKHEYIWCTSISNTCAQSGVLCLQRCMLWGVRRMPAIEPILETTMLIEVVSRHWANEQQSFVVGHCTIESGLLLRGTSCIHRAFQWHWGKMVVHRPANFKPSQLEIQVTSISRFSP